MRKKVLSLALALALCLGLTVPAMAASYTEVVPCKYITAFDFSEGLAAVRGDSSSWGYIDKTGKEVIPCKYYAADPFSEGLAAVAVHEFVNYQGIYRYGYIDKTGKEVIPYKYDWTQPFSEGLAAVRLDGKWGYIDKNGREVIPFTDKYDSVSKFSEGLAAVCVGSFPDEKWGFIDKTGKEVIPCKYGSLGTSDRLFFSEGLARVNLDGKFGFIDKTGKEVVPFKYDVAHNFSEGLATVELDGMWGFIDHTGKEVIPCRYNYAAGNTLYDGGFSEGLAAVQLDGKWGYIDKTGKEVIPCKYFNAVDFSEGYAVVTMQELVDQGTYYSGVYTDSYIDKTGKEVISCKYKDPQSFSEGLARVMLLDENGNHRYGFISVSGVSTSTQPTTPVQPQQPAGTKTASPTNDKLTVDGAAQDPTVYKIDGSNYFKIRDVAAVLNGTEKQFAVGYSGGKVTVTSGQPYEATGKELAGAPDSAKTASPSNDTVVIDGEETDLTVYKIGGSNYFKLRDLGKALNFYVGWEAGRGVYIETDKPYSE